MPIRVSLSSTSGDGWFPFWDVTNLSTGTIQCVLDYDGAFGTGGTVTIQHSTDGAVWVSTSTTFTAAGASSALDLAPLRYIRPKLTTLGSGSPAGYAHFSLHGVPL
jgi:hypothetical protein